jgi:hypothetical protein
VCPRHRDPSSVPDGAVRTAGDGRLPRAWIALLYGRVPASLAATTGVELPADVAAHLLAGASVVMTTSALLPDEPGYATKLLDGLRAWTARKGFETLDHVRGALAESRRRSVQQPALARVGDELSPGDHADLLLDMCAMGFHRPHAEEQ